MFVNLHLYLTTISDSYPTNVNVPIQFHVSPENVRMSIALIGAGFKWKCAVEKVRGLCQKAVIKQGGEDFVACFEGARERAGDFGGAEALAIPDGDFA